MTSPSAGPPEPLARSRLCQDWLALVDKEAEPYRSRFFARLPGDVRAQIDGASRVGWLPMAIHVKLADIQLEAFGSVRAHDYYRRAFGASLQGPILKPLVLTGARVLGLSPGSFVRWASRGYEASYKNGGELTGEVFDHSRARLTFTKLPPICTASDAWVTSAQGSAYGLYDVLEIDGVVRLDTRARAQGKMVLDLEWGGRLAPKPARDPMAPKG